MYRLGNRQFRRIYEQSDPHRIGLDCSVVDLRSETSFEQFSKNLRKKRVFQRLIVRGLTPEQIGDAETR